MGGQPPTHFTDFDLRLFHRRFHNLIGTSLCCRIIIIFFEIPERIGSATSLSIAITKKASKRRRKERSIEAEGGLDWEGTRRQEPKRTMYSGEKNKTRKDVSPQNHFCHYLWSTRTSIQSQTPWQPLIAPSLWWRLSFDWEGLDLRRWNYSPLTTTNTSLASTALVASKQEPQHFNS